LCFLKAAVPARRKNACCISGRKLNLAQAPGTAQQLPYDEFRPRPTQPAPQARPPLLAPGIIQNVNPNVFAAPPQQGQPPAQSGPPAQPYDEFREQNTPQSPPPRLTGPGGLAPVTPTIPAPLQPPGNNPNLLPPAQPAQPPMIAPGQPALPSSPPPSFAAPGQPSGGDIPSPVSPGLSPPPPIAQETPPAFVAPGQTGPAGISPQPIPPTSPPTMAAPGVPLPSPELPPTGAGQPIPAPLLPRPVALPDLSIRFDGMPDRVQQGQELRVPARVIGRNEGGGVAQGNRPGQRGYVVDIILSTDDTVPAGYARYSAAFREDVLLQGGRVSTTANLEGEASAAFIISDDRVPLDTPPGNYRICARIDPGNFITESDEGNNTACTDVRVEVNPAAPIAPGAPGSSLAPGTVPGTGLNQPGIAELPQPPAPVPAPSPSDVIETPGADLLFDFAFDRPVLPPPEDFRNRTMICDSICSQTKARTTLMLFGWPIAAEDEAEEFRLDIALSPIGFEQSHFFSVPFNSQNDDVAVSPALGEILASANFRPEYRPRKHSNKQIYVFGKRTAYVTMEGFLPTGSYWLRLLRRAPAGWRPEASKICTIPVCPADSIR
jgi:hypothetical protein